jgi:PAS domain-containing protein
LPEKEKKRDNLYSSVTAGLVVAGNGSKVEELNQSYLDMLGIAHNNNESKRSEVSMAQVLAWHHSVLSNISDVIGVIGADGLVKFKSPNYERIFGWKPEDVIGKNGLLNIHPDDIEYAQSRF